LAVKIVVDGYNLLNCCREWQRLANRDLSQARAKLLQSLSQYQAQKKHPILVVFDGGRNGWPTEQREQVDDIKIIYSRLGEQADEVIKRIAREWRESAVVVTSDRELADSVTRSGATVISAGRFEGRLRATGTQAGEYTGAGEEWDRPLTTKKKGTAYRRSKKERRRQARLRKL
jgi:hypothetical protein